LLKKLTIHGYSADDDSDSRHEWENRIKGWLADGKICFPQAVIKGLENAPTALARASQGDFFGTVLVKL
jgi:NADPH-dependent curcumin reductase CurA